MPKAVIYCRVSTKEQVSNLSLSTQQKQCSAYCERHGIDVDRVFIEEGESAKTADRTQFKNLLGYCREKKGRIQFVVVYNFTRFARSSLDHQVTRALLAGQGIT